MNFRRLGSIVKKELLQLKRDRLTFAMIIGIPTMQLVLFGYAINLDVRHLDAGRIVADGTPRELLERLPGRTLLVETHDPRRAQNALNGFEGVIALAQIGTALRVLAAAAPDLERRIGERLRSEGVEAKVAPIAPNLEDVFVAATLKQKEKGKETKEKAA